MFFTFLNFLFFSGTGFLCIKIFSLEYYNNLSGCISLGFFGIFLYNIFSIEEKTEFINRLINYLNNSDAFLLSKQKKIFLSPEEMNLFLQEKNLLEIKKKILSLFESKKNDLCVELLKEENREYLKGLLYNTFFSTYSMYFFGSLLCCSLGYLAYYKKLFFKITFFVSYFFIFVNISFYSFIIRFIFFSIIYCFFKTFLYSCFFYIKNIFFFFLFFQF